MKTMKAKFPNAQHGGVRGAKQEEGIEKNWWLLPFLVSALMNIEQLHATMLLNVEIIAIFKNLPYPKGKKICNQRQAYFQVNY
jgi:hypothetical protein